MGHCPATSGRWTGAAATWWSSGERAENKRRNARLCSEYCAGILDIHSAANPHRALKEAAKQARHQRVQRPQHLGWSAHPFKKLEDAPAERNNHSTKLMRQEWMLLEGVNQNLVFVDEAGFNFYTRRTRGRASVGQHAVRQVAGSLGKNLNIIMAILAAAGLHYYELHEDVVNGQIFLGFLDNLGLVIGEGFLVTVVLDNARVHNNAEMDAENHEVKMLPPYSPMLNPIEEAFSCLKVKLSKVKQLLNESMEIILDRAAAAAAQQPLTRFRMRALQGCVTQALDDGVITQDKCNGFLSFTSSRASMHKHARHNSVKLNMMTLQLHFFGLLDWLSSFLIFLRSKI